MLNFSEIGPVVLEKNLFQCCHNVSAESLLYILNLEASLSLSLNPQSPSVDEINLMVSPWKMVSAAFYLYLKKTWIPFTQDCFVSRLVETAWSNVSGKEYKYKTFTDWRRRIDDQKSWHLWFQLGLSWRKITFISAPWIKQIFNKVNYSYICIM